MSNDMREAFEKWVETQSFKDCSATIHEWLFRAWQVVCGQRTSPQEMSDMQTLMEAFGAERGVVWTHKEIEA